MAKIAVIYRNNNRIKLTQKGRPVRDKLRMILKDPEASSEAKQKAMIDLQELPRDSSPCRRRHRCKICGRPRGNTRLTGLCRLHMRLAVINGLVPGMRKASW